VKACHQKMERADTSALEAVQSQTSAFGATRSTFQVSGRRCQVSRSAFTLVEVLISLGIFAVAAVVLGAAYVNILVNYQSMRAWSADREELAFARATLLAEPDRAKAEHGGEIALLAGGNLRWKATIDELPRADLFRVTLDLEVAPPAPLPTRREQEVFLLLRPTWSEPAQREKLRTAFRESLAKRQF
jgi:general secretion pathway protein I